MSKCKACKGAGHNACDVCFGRLSSCWYCLGEGRFDCLPCVGTGLEWKRIQVAKRFGRAIRKDLER